MAVPAKEAHPQGLVGCAEEPRRAPALDPRIHGGTVGGCKPAAGLRFKFSMLQTVPYKFFGWNPGLEIHGLSELAAEAGPRNNSKISLAQDQGERDNCGEFAPPKTRKVGPSDCSACHCSP